MKNDGDTEPKVQTLTPTRAWLSTFWATFFPQLFTAGILLLRHSRLTALDFFENFDNDTYRIDNDGPVPSEESDTVSIPAVSHCISSSNLQLLENEVSPLGTPTNIGQTFTNKLFSRLIMMFSL